jgi:dicarboxylate transporter 10
MGWKAGGIAGIVGNPAEAIMVRMQGDFAKPPEKRLNYKHCFDGLYKVTSIVMHSVAQSSNVVRR